ncbi:hypothetical protein BC937DRAFT_93950 [Endogone sp. FLAS-F59071]|nr:hypothetical protein BC937DRAFT_93950 [Endogone sp. FLAS-F59071]|eukprot:RUS14346.1 hypothetical protein BC937DRAFT_93950 [Endogone sp. FLAS-F59071]
MPSKPTKAFAASAASINPTKLFFHCPRFNWSISQAQAVTTYLKTYGELIEYKFIRASIQVSAATLITPPFPSILDLTHLCFQRFFQCPETHRYLGWGFVVYKNQLDAQNALLDKFHRVEIGGKEQHYVDIRLEKVNKRWWVG